MFARAERAHVTYIRTSPLRGEPPAGRSPSRAAKAHSLTGARDLVPARRLCPSKGGLLAAP